MIRRSVDVVTTEQFSIIAALASFIAIPLGAGLLAAAWIPSVRRRIRPLRRWLLLVGFAVAAASTAGSLYYSEVADFVPCRYCWFQRIAMYPLVVVFGVAALRRDRSAAWTALPLAAIGLAISVYHYRLQLWPTGNSCSLVAPCSMRWVDEFGFVSIPFMAGAGFLALIGVSVASIRSTN